MKQAAAKIEVWPIGKLRRAEYNPRVQLTPEDKEYQDIKNSIERWGYINPILVSADGTIIGGHQRLTVLQDLGYDEVQVVIAEDSMTDDDIKALNIALNKITGRWDEIKLQSLLQELDLNGYDFTLTGFSVQEVDDLNVRIEKEIEPEEDDFDIETAVANAQTPVSKRGDLWLLGEHRLLCGDSTNADDMETLMGGEFADLIVTDPPYNVDYGNADSFRGKYKRANSKRAKSKIINDKMDEDSFYAFLYDAFTQMLAFSQEGAPAYIFHSDVHGATFRNSFTDAGYYLAQCLIWEKNRFSIGRSDYQWMHEPILYGWKQGGSHYFIVDRTQSTVLIEDAVELEDMKKEELIAYMKQIREAFTDQTSILHYDKPNHSDLHPTMKPVGLIGKLLKNSSRPGDVVQDSFGGSGTTIIAAEQLSRRAFLMEMDPIYCDVIVNRWEEYTGKKAILANEVMEDIKL